MIIVAVRPYGKHRSERSEGQDSYFGKRCLANVLDRSQTSFEPADGKLRIRCSRNLSCQVDTAIIVGGVILDGVGEDFENAVS